MEDDSRGEAHRVQLTTYHTDSFHLSSLIVTAAKTDQVLEVESTSWCCTVLRFQPI